MSRGTPSPRQIYAKLPLVYACSGCSGAAQLANQFAVMLDRSQQAEMSCIAGVGGKVEMLVRNAQSGRKILVLDGCPLHCARHCLAQHGIVPDAHVDLSQAGVKKRLHADATQEERQRAWEAAVLPALHRVNAQAEGCHIEDQDTPPADGDHPLV